MSEKEKLKVANRLIKAIGIKGNLEWCRFNIQGPRELRIMCSPSEYVPDGPKIGIEESEAHTAVFFIKSYGKDLEEANNLLQYIENKKKMAIMQEYVQELCKLQIAIDN